MSSVWFNRIFRLYLTKGKIFRGGREELLNIKYVFLSLDNFYPQIFLILNRIWLDITINLYRSSRNVHVILNRL